MEKEISKQDIEDFLEWRKGKCKAITKKTGRKCRLNATMDGYCIKHFKWKLDE